MTLPSCAVSCLFHSPDGEPKAGLQVEARLDRPDAAISAGFVVPERVFAETDPAGCAVLRLWPNELGTLMSSYRFRINDPRGGTSMTMTAVVPNTESANLHEILTELPAV
jgi:hypothetical protein